MSRRERRRAEDEHYRVWKGGYRPYDLVKEASIALGVVLALAVVLTILFSSPDAKPSTVKSWARTDPVDFVTTATTELDGSSGTATYGPPYNHSSGGVQHAWFLHPQRWLGVSHPINTSQDFVLAPLRSVTGQPALQTAVTTYENAPAKQQADWTSAYETALGKQNAPPAPTGSSYGPLPTMMTGLLHLAQSGGLDGALLTSRQFYQTDYTKPLLFMADGGFLEGRAGDEHLLGDQWGMMNETGTYPGQVWLWLYTFWYQITPFQGGNADLLVMLAMGALSLLFVLVPFLPVINRIPRWIPVYKLIWRDHYRGLSGPPAAAPPPSRPLAPTA